MSRPFLLAVCLLLATLSCRDIPPAPFVSDLKMSKPFDARQLLAGFWNVENGQWRWTKHQFAVVLLPPAQRRNGGATLVLSFTIPPSHINVLGPFTVSADVGETSLSPETYTTACNCQYVRSVPSDLLTSNLLPVVFTVNKFLTPEQADGRELSVVVTEVALR